MIIMIVIKRESGSKEIGKLELFPDKRLVDSFENTFENGGGVNNRFPIDYKGRRRIDKTTLRQQTLRY
jgi:hypothetical protein